jgi:hypothetical protein
VTTVAPGRLDRVFDVLLRRKPANDERSTKAEQVAELQTSSDEALIKADHVLRKHNGHAKP